MPIRRVLALWLITSFSLILLSYVLPGLSIKDYRAALVAAALIGIVNAVLWPTLTNLTLRLNLLTFGAFTLVLNGFIVWLVASIDPGMQLDGFLAAIVVSLGLAAINTLLSSLFSINDDRSYYRHVLRKKIRKRVQPTETDVPGIIFLEIDGLSKPVLLRAIRNGHAPTLSRWLEQGTHCLASWECDLSSQTASSQAGILLGNNHDIPAFRWFEKSTGRIIVASQLADIAEIEKRQSHGNGLLSKDGLSLSNMFSGDTRLCYFTMSKVKEPSDFQKDSFYYYLVDPYNFLRGLMLAFWDVFLEVRSKHRQKSRDIKPRLDHRERSYPVVRALTTTVLRELSVYTLIGEMFAGFPAAYVTLFGYDEVAHHSGVEREDAMEVLRKIDQQINRLTRASSDGPRPYEFVILSDHGQSQGATFYQRFGMKLEDLVKELVAGKAVVDGINSVDEHWSYISTPITDAVRSDQERFTADVLRRATSSRTRDREVILGPERETLQKEPEEVSHEETDVVVMASGNLGLIYFKSWPERMSMEQLNLFFPELIRGLALHPGIGFVMVRSDSAGPLAIGAEGIRYLEDGRVEGTDPLAKFGPNAARHLLRTDSFAHAGDIMVNSFYDPETDEVAAFEELIGSHGGLGGDQSKPFILFPADWEFPRAEIVGSEQLHRVMKGWLNDVRSKKQK